MNAGPTTGNYHLIMGWLNSNGCGSQADTYYSHFTTSQAIWTSYPNGNWYLNKA